MRDDEVVIVITDHITLLAVLMGQLCPEGSCVLNDCTGDFEDELVDVDFDHAQINQNTPS